MITTTHSHKHWTDEGGHVRITAYRVAQNFQYTARSYSNSMAFCQLQC